MEGQEIQHVQLFKNKKPPIPLKKATHHFHHSQDNCYQRAIKTGHQWALYPAMPRPIILLIFLEKLVADSPRNLLGYIWVKIRPKVGKNEKKTHKKSHSECDLSGYFIEVT